MANMLAENAHMRPLHQEEDLHYATTKVSARELADVKYLK
jgi:hypothetical protein